VIKYRPGKLAGKPDILSRESGDSLWERDIKHRQNYGRILLPEEVFEALQANTTETINLEIDKELLNEIPTLSVADKDIQEIWRKKGSGTTRDGKIALGLLVRGKQRVANVRQPHMCPGRRHPMTTHINRPP